MINFLIRSLNNPPRPEDTEQSYISIRFNRHFYDFLHVTL